MDPEEADNAAAPTFTPADRIAELNEIDQSVAKLLSAASDAVAILSNSSSNDKQRAALRNAATAKAAFTNAADTYFSTLSSVEVRLRRQVYALEEAGLINPGDEIDARKGRSLASELGTGRTGGGPLDPSWLNARVNDSVEKGMKQDLIAQAKEFLKGMEEGSQKSQEEVSAKQPER
jgi:hypothetical protein